MRGIWSFAGGGALLVAGVAWMVAWAVYREPPMAIPEHAVDGIASRRLRWVEVGVRVRGRTSTSWHLRPLLTELQGERQIEVGGVRFRVDDPMKQLKNWTLRSQRFDTLDGVPEAKRIRGWERLDAPKGF